MMPVITLQRKLMELGRVRLGEKGPRGEPRKLSHFRFTSASEALLQQIAARYGGTVRAWEGAPDEGYFEVTTKASEIEIILPPGYNEIDGRPGVRYSQWYELWSGGGCQRRCDGVTEGFTAGPCLCQPLVAEKGEDARACKITTRVSFMLPGSEIGVWRLDTHGYYAAVEAPAMLDFLSNNSDVAGQAIPAALRIEHRTRKVGGQTRKFIVPVISFPQVNIPEIESVGSPSLAINAPAELPPRPALPPVAPALPVDASFKQAEEAVWGEEPEAPYPSTLEPDDALLSRLYAAADTLGNRDATIKALEKNRHDHADDPAKHLKWLETQVKRAEAAVEAKKDSLFKAPVAT